MTIEELTALSDEELRVKVAEKMGWKMHNHPDCLAKKKGWISQYWRTWVMKPNGELTMFTDIPPFSTSLDAIHEAEKTLTKEQRRKWVSHLDVVHPESLLFSCYDEDELKNEAFLLIHATARQRAIAFLMV